MDWLGSALLAVGHPPARAVPQPVFRVTSAMGFVVGFALFGALTYLPLFQQVVRGLSPTASGLQLIPLMAGVLISSIGSGQLISRTGRYKVFPIVGTALAAVGMCGRRPAAAMRDAYLSSFTEAIGTVFWVGACVVVVAFVLSWLLPERPLRRPPTSPGCAPCAAAARARCCCAWAARSPSAPPRARARSPATAR